MDTDTYYTFVAALIFVVALIVLVFWLFRRLGLGAGMGVHAGGGRRLRVREALMVDAKHRLVLVRRDDVEHLLLLGPSGSTLVEGGIPSPADDDTRPAHPGPSFKRQLARLMPGAARSADG